MTLNQSSDQYTWTIFSFALLLSAVFSTFGAQVLPIFDKLSLNDSYIKKLNFHFTTVIKMIDFCMMTLYLQIKSYFSFPNLCAFHFFFLSCCTWRDLWYNALKKVRVDILALFIILWRNHSIFQNYCNNYGVCCRCPLLDWGNFLLFLDCWGLLWFGVEFCQVLPLHLLRWSCGFFVL